MACGSCSSESGGGCGCGSGGGCGIACPSVSVHNWLPKGTPSSPDLVEVAFKHRRRRIFRNDRNLDIGAGDDIIVGVKGGIDFGHVTMTGELVLLRAGKNTRYQRVIRVANSRDQQRHKENRQSEGEALATFRAAVRRRGISLKAVDAEWQHDRKRISFYYSTEGKVALRNVIADLGRRFKARVDLKRVSAREEAARIGGIGVCGRELCCSSWMHVIPKVSLSAAKAQHFPLSPERLRGRCNRLKCCLNYELEQYMAALKEFPRKGRKVRTKSGQGKVIKVDIFRRTMLVKYPDGETDTVSVDSLKQP